MTTTAVPIHVLDADSTRAEVEEALGWANRDCKRAPHVVKRFDDSPPTRWDKTHDWVSALLDMWQAAGD